MPSRTGRVGSLHRLEFADHGRRTRRRPVPGPGHEHDLRQTNHNQALLRSVLSRRRRERVSKGGSIFAVASGSLTFLWRDRRTHLRGRVRLLHLPRKRHPRGLRRRAGRSSRLRGRGHRAGKTWADPVDAAKQAAGTRKRKAAKRSAAAAARKGAKTGRLRLLRTCFHAFEPDRIRALTDPLGQSCP